MKANGHEQIRDRSRLLARGDFAMPTIRDVAERAKTSKSTVSRLLNGQSVKKVTADAIMKAIEDLNYHANVHARRLVLNKTQTIGVVVDDISNSFYSEILSAIEDVAGRKGYRCVFYSGYRNTNQEKDFVSLCQEGQVDGLLMVRFAKRDRDDVLAMGESRLPIVLIGDDAGVGAVHSVDVDNFSGVADVVRHLVALGHRAIAYIEGVSDQLAAAPVRSAAFEMSMKGLGLIPRGEHIVQGAWSMEGGYEAMVELLSRRASGTRFTAVVTSNDRSAAGAMKAIHEAGLLIPQDIAVVGFDDIEVASLIHPALTTVRQPTYEMGRRAIEALFMYMSDDKQFSPVRELVKPMLVVRASTGLITDATDKV